MKQKILVLLLCIISILKLNVSIAQVQGPIETTISGHGEMNFSQLADWELKHPPKLQRLRNFEEKDEQLKGIPQYLPVPPNAKFNEFDANAIITRMGPDNALATSPAPIVSFNGLLDNNTTIPPDVNGAAGPSDLFETLNSQYRIFSKTGATIKTLSPSSFWSGLNTVGSPFSDPHVVYDAAGKKWIACTIGKLKTGNYALFVAVSQTTDPSGTWFQFSVDTGPSSTLPDYPLLGYNKNWIVITTNDFFNNSFKQSRITIFNKASLYANAIGTVKTFFDTQLFTISPAETMDSSLSVEYLLTNYNGNSGGKGYVKISKITGGANNPVYAQGPICGVNQPWSESGPDAPQLGSTQLINVNGTKMRSVIVANGSIWATHTIYLPIFPTKRTAVDWWQIRPADSTVLQYGRIDDPTGALFYAFPSMAVKRGSNSLLIGASMFGKTIYASSVYAYRNGNDALNTLRSPYTYKAGLAPYYKTLGGSRNRWGDYTATCLDPADGSFWTLQEFANTGSNKWGTVWANVAAVASPAPVNSPAISKRSVDVLNINPNPNKGVFTVSFTASKSGVAKLIIYGHNSTVIYSADVNITEGINNLPVKIDHLPTGEYVVSLSTDGALFEGKLIAGQ